MQRMVFGLAPTQHAALSVIPLLAGLTLLSPGALAAPLDQPRTFAFNEVISLEDMREFIVGHFPLGTPREVLQQTFVHDGGARLVIHPRGKGVEKYIYDINLCDRYIWRWNISGDYDPSGRLAQAYVNGEPVFQQGAQKRDGAAMAKSGQAKIYKMSRSRPEALHGETQLSYLLLDADGDLRTVDDQVLSGSGPSRADAVDMGKIHSYANVEPWRSIFDDDAAQGIAHYSGDCR